MRNSYNSLLFILTLCSFLYSEQTLKKLIADSKLYSAYQGEWKMIAPENMLGKNSEKGFFYLVEDSIEHLYIGKRRFASSGFWIENGSILSSDGYDTIIKPVTLKDDTLFLSESVKLVKCKNGFPKDTFETIFHENIPELSIHKVLPVKALDTWVANKLENSDTSLIRKSMAGTGRLISYKDSSRVAAAIEKCTEDSDKAYVVIGSKIEFRTTYCMLDLVERASVLDGTHIESIKVRASLDTLGSDEIISFQFNQEGKDKLTSLTTDFEGGSLAIVVNGEIFSMYTSKEPIRSGIITTKLPNPEGLPVTEGLNTLKKWGL